MSGEHSNRDLLNRDQRILVTGACGFIGRHFVHSMLYERAQIIAVDNWPVIPEDWSGFLREGTLSVHQADTGDFDSLAAVFEAERPGKVVHLAGLMGKGECAAQPELCYHSNVTGMYNLLSLCTSSQVLTLVYTSTAGVYAGLNKVCTEEDAPVFPDSLYGLSKLTAEFMMQSCCVSYGMNGHVLRVGNVYGPGQRDTRVIQRFTRQIDSGEELAIRGSLQSRRNYLYIDDCVAALRISLDRCSGFDVFNIGGDRDVPLGEIITLLSSYLNRKAEIKPPTLPLRSQNGEDHIRIDTTRSRERLGFTPAVSIEEGLKRFVDWYNEQKQEQRE